MNPQNVENIPQELKDLSQWVCRNEAKEPINPHNGRLASVTNPNDWGTFEQACEAVKAGKGVGIGFVMTEGDPFACIDLDVKPGEAPTELQKQVLEQFPGYAEISPSGRGLHVWVKGAVPTGRNKEKVEIYSSGRYMTVTGNVFRSGGIHDCNDRLNDLWRYLDRSAPVESSANPVVDPNPAPKISDDALRECVCGSPVNADHFNGKSGANPSDAHFAVLNAACLFSSDEAQVRRVVLASPLVQNGPPGANGETRQQKVERLWGTEYPRAARRGAQERHRGAQAAAHGAQIAAGIAPQPVGSPRSRLRSARDLQHKHFAPINWVLPGIVPEGLAFLASVPKFGKSWWTLDAARAKADGDLFMGQQCEPGDVLLLALEDNDRRMQDRLRRVTGGDAWPANLEYATEWPRLDEGGLDDIRNWIESKSNPALIVIDTLAMVKPVPTRGNKSAYDLDVQAVKPLQQLASEKRVAIIVVTHTRKAESEDPLESVTSTLGLTGVADTVIVLKRGPNKGTGIMYGRGRDIAEFEKAIKFENFHWIDDGSPKEVFAGDTQKVIMEAIRNGATTPKDMEALTGMSGENVRQTLQRMQKNQIVFKTGYGQYQLPTWAAGGSIYDPP